MAMVKELDADELIRLNAASVAIKTRFGQDSFEFATTRNLRFLYEEMVYGYTVSRHLFAIKNKSTVTDPEGLLFNVACFEENLFLKPEGISQVKASLETLRATFGQDSDEYNMHMKLEKAYQDLAIYGRMVNELWCIEDPDHVSDPQGHLKQIDPYIEPESNEEPTEWVKVYTPDPSSPAGFAVRYLPRTQRNDDQ